MACTVMAVAVLSLLGCESEPGQPMRIMHQELAQLQAGQRVSIPIVARGDLPTLVSMLPFEAVLSAGVRGAGEQNLSEHSVDYRRGVPLYLVVDPAPGRQSFDLELEVQAATNRARVDIEVASLPSASRADQGRISAYRAYQSATEAQPGMQAALWEQRKAAFTDAAQSFARVGLQREALWSELLALVVAYHPLSEIERVLDLAPGLADRARSAGYHDISVVAKQLSGQALMYLGGDADTQTRSRAMAQAVEQFRESAKWSGEHELRFEEAWSWNNQGIARHYQGDFQAAIQAYAGAAAVAAQLDDPYLDAVIRSNRAAALEKSGHFDAAASELTGVIAWQRGQGASMELAFSLKRLADVELARYRFMEAIGAYREAAEIAESHADRELAGYSLLALGSAWFELGEPDRALETINRAIELLDPASAPAGLNQAHAAAAGIHRLQGNATRTFEYRALQQPVSDLEKASFFLERAKDQLLLPTTGERARQPADVRADLQAAQAHAAQAGREDWVQLAALYECLHFADPADVECSDSALQARLASPGVQARPASFIEASVALSRIQLRSGNTEAALAQLDEVTTEMGDVRDHLRGTEGAWFWQSRADILDQQLGIQIERDLAGGDPVASLLMLDGFRNRDLDSDRMSGDQQRGLQDAVPARERLAAVLHQLPADSAVLTWFFSDSGVYRWVIGAKGVELVRISADASLVHEVRELHGSLRTIGDASLEQRLAMLGSTLLAGMDDGLPPLLFVITGGPLNGFPVDALMIGGEHLAARHQVVYLHSLDSIASLAALREPWKGGRMAFAGAPVAPGESASFMPGAVEEISTLANRFGSRSAASFVGPRFTPDIIGSSDIVTADLVHFATHAVVNLAHPEVSRIQTSRSAEGARDSITPADIRKLEFSATLVVLSACETAGSNAFRFDSNLGFVSEFLGAGATSVLATLFPTPDRSAGLFMNDFYQNLDQGQSILQAFSRAKQKHQLSTPLAQWAAFQLFVR